MSYQPIEWQETIDFASIKDNVIHSMKTYKSADVVRDASHENAAFHRGKQFVRND